jgi:hypothetical protein
VSGTKKLLTLEPEGVMKEFRNRVAVVTGVRGLWPFAKVGDAVVASQ